MTSARETALAALHVRLASTGVTAQRNPAGLLPDKITDSGLIILRDGDQGEPEITLSPQTYHWAHRVQIEVYARPRAQGGGAARDEILLKIDSALTDDRALGGAVEWLELSGGVVTLPPPPGAAVPPADMIEATLFYTSSSPLG